MKMKLKYALPIVLTVCILATTFTFAPIYLSAQSNVELPVNITVVPAGSILAQSQHLRPSDWAKASVNSLREKKLIPSGLDNNYQNPITRAEFAVLLVNAYEYAKKETIQKTEHSFTDIKGHKYEDALVKAKSAGLINGVSTTSMNPDGTLTREQAAVMLYNLIQNVENIETGYTPKDYRFSDRADISPWADEAIYNLFDKGIISGTGNDKFSPKINLTREMGMILINKTIDKFKWQ